MSKKKTGERKQKGTDAIPEEKFLSLDLSGKWEIGLLAGIFFLLVLWGFLSDGTWDDDCPTRYYLVRNAFNDPLLFINLWVRPLFAVLYVIPVQFGKNAIIFETALVTVLTCHFLYRSAQLAGIKNAIVVIPLLAFQAFYFPISFNALSEPLAALILALGLYLHLQKRYFWFAILGGLLPLARLELAPLLLFWAFILLREKRWQLIIFLGMPTLLWNLAGTYLEGDWVWLWNHVFTGEPNKYGQGSFWQYFQRYIFFTGPVIFYLFLIGLFERFYNRKFDWISGQFLMGFLLYVLFSWKLSVGQAAGFMRNLAPLSGLAALLALEGFNLHFQPQSNGQSSNLFKKQVVYIAIILLLTVVFLSKKLVIHHIVTAEPQYLSLLLMMPLVLTYLIANYFIPSLSRNKSLCAYAALLVTGLSVGYTLITEPPIGLTTERHAMGQVAKWYTDSNLQGTMVFVNHIWFFYAEDLDYYADTFDRVTEENLDRAKPGSIVIWENHYSHRLRGDVQFTYFQGKPYKNLGQIKAQGSNFFVTILQKMG